MKEARLQKDVPCGWRVSTDGARRTGRLPRVAMPVLRRTECEEGRRDRRVFSAALALLALLPAACVAIGPTANIAPGPGKSPEAFASDRRSCMADIDRRLQPVADRINTLGISASTNAANNQHLQADYDRGFNDCMAARGNMPDPGLVRSAAFSEPLPPSSTQTTSNNAADTLPGGWKLLQQGYHGGLGEAKDANDSLWSREIENPSIAHGHVLSVESMSFQDGDKTLLLSIAGQGEPACDNGPNDVNATRDYAVCPGKLAFIQDGRLVSTRSAGSICAESIDVGVQPGAPDWKSPRLWGTRGRYDAASGTIELVTMQHGRAEPVCTKRLRVR